MNRRSSLEDEFEREEIEDELEDERSPPRVHFSDENGKQMQSPMPKNSKYSGDGSRGGPEIPALDTLNKPMNQKYPNRSGDKIVTPLLDVSISPSNLGVNY